MLVKAIKVNNYNELAEAIKKLYIDYVISDSAVLQFEYSNGIIGDQQILSMSCDEYVYDFCESRPMIFTKNYKAKNFFSKIRNGKIIKCDFPAIVCDEVIIEVKDIASYDNYELFSKESFLNEYLSIKEIERMMKKEMYVYLNLEKGCILPIKKSKEEILSFIKENCVSFGRKINNEHKNYFSGRINVNGDIVIISKRPMNNKVEKLFNFLFNNPF